jgi:histidyl-tRNA synthetase
MADKYTLPRGTNDILPAQIKKWRFIEDAARKTFFLFNYQEIRTPLFEDTELFARSMGQTSDVVMKQMLNLAAQNVAGENSISLSGLSLRPENTASVVRSYIQNNLDRKEQLSKLFYIGPMFRGERPQKGRLRQFHQIGGEVIGPGSGTPFMDAEVILLAVNLLKSFGLKEFKLKINTLGSAEDKERLSSLLRDKLNGQMERLCPDCQQRFNRNVFRVIDCKSPECKAVVKDIALDYDYLSPDSQKYYSDVKTALDELGVAFEESMSLVRGLDYYTHTVFEITSSLLGSQDALGAGGRYNSLVAQLGGSEGVDAIGFALGMERILLALGEAEDTNPSQVDAFVMAMNEGTLKAAFLLGQDLRANDISTEMFYKTASMKNQMRAANKAQAAYVLILGEEELAANAVMVKNMSSGEQERVNLENVIRYLKDNLKQNEI